MEITNEISLDSTHLKKLSIPSTSYVDNYVVYHIEVSLADYSWTVKRRYREFCELHDKLTRQFHIDQTSFPPKKYFGNFEPTYIEKRRLRLEAYLQNLVSQLRKIPRPLQIFLEFHIYDVLAVTQTLAEELFKIGDRLLANEETFVVTPIQLYCISKRLKLPIPTCGGGGYSYDVGNLYDIVYCVQNLKIAEDEDHNLVNSSEEEISFDMTLFKNIRTLQISKCNIESLQGTYHLQQNLQQLSVHNSLHLLKDILIDQDVWTHDAYEDILKQGITWKHLTELDCSHNDIPYIDESVTLLHELVSLDLSYNKIEEIAHLQDLPNLRELNLSFNEIYNLRNVNTKLGNITTLRLAGNKLGSVGDTSKMFSLINLDLSENSISDITDAMSLAKLPCLENLVLLANPLRHKDMYRIQLLAAFENRVSHDQICLDKIITTEAEIKDVMQLLAEEDAYEFVNAPCATPGTPRKNKNARKKTPERRMKIKTQDVLDASATEAASIQPTKVTGTNEEQEFRDRVERMRRLGGDAWLGLLNESQNEKKGSTGHQSSSLPVLSSLATDMDINDQNSKNRQPSTGHSQLQFCFSAQLEEIVIETMKEDKDIFTGTFFVSVEGDGGEEEERMVGVDLKRGVLMEIVIDTGETSRKCNLDEITSVDILESPESLFVDLARTQHKELRRHSEFHAPSGNSSTPGDFVHVAKYRMRSMNDAAELFVLLYKFVSESLSVRSPEKSEPVPSQTQEPVIGNDVASIYCNPIGVPAELLQQFLSSKLVPPMESELTESGRHAALTGDECVHLILWVSCLPYALPEHEFPVGLVLTELNIYLFQLVQPDSFPARVDEMEKVLSLMCCAPLTELCGVVRGVFDLTFRLEFSKRGPHGTFTFLARDSDMTESFVKALEKVTTSSGTVSDMRSYSIVSTSESSLEKLKQEIAMSCGKTFRDDEFVIMYAVVRELTEMTSSTDDHVEHANNHVHYMSATRSLVLTSSNLFLCEEDHIHWPLPSYVRDSPSTPQWVVTKHHDVKHIVGIEVYDVIGDSSFVGTSGMALLLEANPAGDHVEDTSRATEVWNVIFKLKEEREQFQRSLSHMWSYNFDGKLETTKSRPMYARDILHTPRVDITSQFFQGGLPTACTSQPNSPRSLIAKAGHRRNASGQFHPVLNEESMRRSLQVLHNASVELLEDFFNETLRRRSRNDSSETLVSYAWTGCVAYTHPTREVHVWLVLSSSNVYLVADTEDRTLLSAREDAVFGTGTNLCFHWSPLTGLRQVCVGFFDQTFRLETDDPASTFTFITRDYEVTGCFLEHLKSALTEIGTTLPAPATTASDYSPSIYDAYPSGNEMDNEVSSEEKFHHSKGVVRFLYTSDDTVEILKHSILEYGKESEYFKCLADSSILLYLLVFQLIDGKKLPRTFMVLDHALCTCVENHVNFPLPLFVKGLPMGSRYEMQRLRLITDIKRIEFSGFTTQDFTIVYKKERPPSDTEERTGESDSDAVVGNSACPDGEERWTMIVQTYEEKEKALKLILNFWKENVGEDLPVLKI